MQRRENSQWANWAGRSQRYGKPLPQCVCVGGGGVGVGGGGWGRGLWRRGGGLGFALLWLLVGSFSTSTC